MECLSPNSLHPRFVKYAVMGENINDFGHEADLGAQSNDPLGAITTRINRKNSGPSEVLETRGRLKDNDIKYWCCAL